MAAKHLRLESDVARMVATMSKRNSRSTAREVNHVLRTYYTEELAYLTGVGPGEPMPPSFTRLNPLPATPRTHDKNMTNARE